MKKTYLANWRSRRRCGKKHIWQMVKRNEKITCRRRKPILKIWFNYVREWKTHIFHCTTPNPNKDWNISCFSILTKKHLLCFSCCACAVFLVWVIKHLIDCWLSGEILVHLIVLFRYIPVEQAIYVLLV